MHKLIGLLIFVALFPIFTHTAFSQDTEPTPETASSPAELTLPLITLTLTPTIPAGELLTPTLTLSPTATPASTPSATPTAEVTSSPSATLAPTITIKLKNDSTTGVTEEPSTPAERQPLLMSIDHKPVPGQAQFRPGEVLVKFKSDKVNLSSQSGRDKAKQLAKNKNLTLADQSEPMNLGLLRASDARTVTRLISEIEQDENVDYAQPNYIYHTQGTGTNDPYSSSMWGLDNTGTTYDGVPGVVDADIDAPAAWAYSVGANTIVAVIDTGVSYNHPDLQANMWDGSACVSDSHNYIGNCSHGYDYLDNDTTPLPGMSEHGTHVAGTIAAIKNNGAGTVGVAPSTKIMAIRTDLTSLGNIKSVNFARYNGADIINASWGGYSNDPALKTAIDAFPGLFVAAAGNDGLDLNTYPIYPCSFTSANVICVAASTHTDALADYSNYGSTAVDIAAPGSNIVSTSFVTSTGLPLNQNFNYVTPPNIPTGWTENGDWITYDFGSEIVLYGDYHYPYIPNANTSITSSVISIGSYNGAEISFDTRCDTEYLTDGWGDYMSLWVSANGTSFTEILRWDEAYLEDMGIRAGDYTFSSLSFELPSQYITDNFKLRFGWVTNSSNSGTVGDGCYVDNLQINTRTAPINTYLWMDGTSMATPHVSGAAAVILATNSSLTPAQLKTYILNYGDSKPAFNTKTTTGKRLNLYTSLANAMIPTVPVATPNGGTHNGTIFVTLSASNGTIHYTTNGATPDCNSATYSSSIKVSSSLTIKAINCGILSNSAVMSKSFTIIEPVQTWYLAEGYTGGAFTTYVLLQNPNNFETTATVSYLIQGGSNFSKTYVLSPNSRFTINVNNDIGTGKSTSTKVASSQNIIVERAMYWDAGGDHWAGGHNTTGTTTLGTTWYLAEGYTGGSFATYALIQNPTDASATVTATYMIQGGENVVKQYTVPANSRYTINVNNEIGTGKSVSTKFESTQNIIVERAMYWDAGGDHWAGGHNTTGVIESLNLY